MGLVLAGSVLLLVSGPAFAHYCKQDQDNEACNAHWCPDDGEYHHHIHALSWRPDHSCTSAPTKTAFRIDPPELIPTTEESGALPSEASIGSGAPAAALAPALLVGRLGARRSWPHEGDAPEDLAL